MAHLQLDSRLTSNMDFTRRYEITFSLLDCIECPICMEISNEMTIFNHQYYDKRSFDRHERAKTTRNHNRLEIRLKDPRTGYDFDPQYAIQFFLIILVVLI